MWFDKNINKTFTRNTRKNAKNLALEINVHWTFLSSRSSSQKYTFSEFIAMFHFHTIYGAAFSKPKIHCFSLRVKTPQNKTSLIKCKMDIFDF